MRNEKMNKLPTRYCKHCGHKLESHDTGYICTHKTCTYYDYDLVQAPWETLDEFLERATNTNKK